MRHRYLFLAVFLLPAAFISVTGDVSRTLLAVQEDDCAFEDITPAIAAILCAVERKAWIISKSSSAVKNAGCLLSNLLFKYIVSFLISFAIATVKR